MNSGGSSSNPGGSTPSGGPGSNPPTGGPGGQPSNNTPLSQQAKWDQKIKRGNMAHRGKILHDDVISARQDVNNNTPSNLLNRKEAELRKLTESFISHERDMINNNNLDVSANRTSPAWRVMGEAFIRNQDRIKNELDIKKFT